jgi:outer membrane protein insertion porin family
LLKTFSPPSLRLLAVLAISIQGFASDQKIVDSVSILGSDASIPLESRAGEALDAAKLERDVKTLWRSGRFSDIRVEAAENEDHLRLVFHATEKPHMRVRKVEVTPPTPGIDLDIEPNSAVDELRAQQIASAVRARLESSGFPEAKVEAKLLPVRPGWSDLQIKVDKGRNIKIKEVTLSGDLAVKPSAAMSALRSTRSKTMLPGIPGVWKGWRLPADYTDGAVQADISSLRSFYYKRGYFDANIRLNSVDIASNHARIDLDVKPGPRYAIRQFRLVSGDGERQITPDVDGGFPAKSICAGLMAERRKAEQAGVLDFAARIEVREAPGASVNELTDGRRWADLTATVQRGPAYRVGRIEFRGNRSFSDITIRRMLLVKEAEPLDETLLRRSLDRLNRTGLFEPLTEASVVVNTPTGSDRADLTLWMKERKSRHWYLSGPVGPMSVAGPLQFAIGSRLPPWGQGLLEMSTYVVSLKLALFAKPLSSLLPIFPNKRFFPELTIARPQLPGQHLLSGFTIAPQFGWQGILAGYGLSKARESTTGLFENKHAYIAELPVTITHVGLDPKGHPREDMMYCEAPKTKLDWTRQISGMGVNLFFSFLPF